MNTKELAADDKVILKWQCKSPAKQSGKRQMTWVDQVEKSEKARFKNAKLYD